MYSKSLKALSEISAITGNSYNEIVGEDDGLNFVWHEDNFHVHYEMNKNRININNYTETECFEIDRIKKLCESENIILG
jgi:hypothetical protein